MAKNNSVSIEELKGRDPNLVAGPGADIDAGAAPLPLLQGASEYEYVELLNPLSVEFIGMFGVSRPVNAPVNISTIPGRGVTTTENDLRTGYGLDLRNTDHPGRANIVNRVSIKSGTTVRLLGSEAQVVIKQLVNEVMAREGNQALIADPHARRQVEERLVIRRGLVADYMGRAPVSVTDQLQAIKDEPDEQEFPDISTVARDTSDAPAQDSSRDGNSGEFGSGAGTAKTQRKAA